MLNNMTALVSCFARSYHTLNSNIKIYDDKYARKMLSDDEYNNISLSMISGIEFFDSSYEGNNTLGFIVNNHLAPAVLARSSFNERHLNNEIRLGLSQYVILGSGYDTSAYKVNDKVKVFELDKEEMICDKKKRVLKGTIDCSNVSYIECDFNKNAVFHIFTQLDLVVKVKEKEIKEKMEDAKKKVLERFAYIFHNGYSST